MTPRASARAVPRPMAGVASLVVVLVVALLFADALTGRASRAPLADPRPAPALSGHGLDGAWLDLARFDGKVVVVNVWASWCAPCREELPLLAEAADHHRDDGLRVLGLNANDRPEAAAQLLRDLSVALPSISDPDGERAVAWGVRGVPETFVIDRDGWIVARHAGEVTSQWIDETVLPLLPLAR